MNPRAILSIFLLALGLVLTLPSCSLTEPAQGIDILPETAKAKIPSEWSAGHANGPVTPNWVMSFGDAELARVVDDAIARNPDLRVAAAKVEASQAAVRIAAASLYPYIGLKGLGERQGQELSGALGTGMDPASLGSTGVNLSGGSAQTRSLDASSGRWIYGTGIGAAWELDVWGRVRSKRAAAISDSESLQADYHFARQSLAAQVVRAYYSGIEASQQESNARETLKLYEEYLKLTQIRKEQGFSSDYELAQVKSRTAAVRDGLHSAEAARAHAIRSIEVVTSNYPAGKASVPRSLPNSLRPVPAGLPSELLERRPDLIAAERRFAAAFHRVNEAKAARLPRFAISAAGGIGSAQLDGVGTLDTITWSLASGIVQPIFFGGELKAAQDLRTAEQKAAAADYVATALRAFQEVEDALADEYYFRQRDEALREMVSSSADAVRLGRQQLDQGQTDMFTLLRLIGENLAAKVELTKVRAARLRLRADLHLALGGDFTATEQ